MSSIKFYANYSDKDKRYFISGRSSKKENGKAIFFSLWANPDFESKLYFDTDLFKKGVEIDKTLLKVLPREDGQPSRVLVFKDEAEQNKYCISKEEIEKRKNRKSKGISNSYCEYVLDLFKDLFKANENLKIGEFIQNEISLQTPPADCKEVDEDDDLPF